MLETIVFFARSALLQINVHFRKCMPKTLKHFFLIKQLGRYILCAKYRTSFIYRKMRKHLLTFQRFDQGKIEFGPDNTEKSQGNSFLIEDGHPAVFSLPDR